MSIGAWNWSRSCLLLSVCLGGCTGGQSGQPAIGPVAVMECHSLAADEKGYGQSPHDVLDAFPSQTDVPTYWVNASIERPTSNLEQSDVVAETRMTFTVRPDESREISECVLRACPPGKCATADGCDANECAEGTPSFANIVVPVVVTLMTEDGVDATLEMDLSRTAPVTPYPANAPALLWHTPETGSNSLGVLSSKAAWASPGFGEFRMSYDGTTFMGRFNHPERGLAVWPTPCGGQLQVSPRDVVGAQAQSVASAIAGIEQRHLTSVDSNMPDVTVTVALDDPTVCYDGRGEYDVDVRITVETDNAAFEGVTSLRGNLSSRDDILADWQDVCGDVSSSIMWSNTLKDAVGGGDICVDGQVRKTKPGLEIAAEITTAKPNADGWRIGWAYGE